MIFVGDIALPYSGAVTFSEIPNEFSSKQWFGNLEGAIMGEDNNQINAVYNRKEAVKKLISKFDFKGFALANNHIFDTGDLDQTRFFLSKHILVYCGVGNNINEANREVILHEGNQQIVVINFGWEVIQCEIASNKKEGVNPLTRSNVLDSIRAAINKYPDAKIVTYMHWSYELEAEPQPFERELAKRVIDLGVWGVIGSHPHRVGGFELYKGRPIVYSLGNWMFKQNYYFDGKLSFPDFCNLELAFEWDFVNDDYKFHFFEYNRDTSELTYLRTEGKESPTMIAHTPFLGLSDKEYRSWYKKNHYHRNKGLPIYYWSDSDFTIMIKNSWNKARDYLLKALLNKGK